MILRRVIRGLKENGIVELNNKYNQGLIICDSTKNTLSISYTIKDKITKTEYINKNELKGKCFEGYFIQQ